MALMAAKTEQIQIRVSAPVKRAIETAAKKNGRTLTNYILWLMSHNDEGVAQAILNDR